MPDNINKKVLLIGAGQMSVDYFNVLQELKCDVTIVGRSEKSASEFAQKTGKQAISGGIEAFLKENNEICTEAIVAVGMEQLASTTAQLIKHGFKKILVEKPAGLNSAEIKELDQLANQHQAKVAIAYNRRFYASVLKAREIIEQDGGVSSFNFEFTEWAHIIEKLDKKEGIKSNWLLANSTHVIDLAFYLGGKPSEISCFTAGELSWYKRAVFSGAGQTEKNALFSYQANWDAPGRWALEVITSKSRLVFRPLEELQIQLKGSVLVNKVEIDNSLDTRFKPGLFVQTKKFLKNELSEFNLLSEQAKMVDIYDHIANGKQ